MSGAQLELNGAWERIKVGQLDQAEATCRALLAESPELIETEFALGVICSRKGDKAAALAHLERFLSKRPDDVNAFGLAAQLFLETGQTDRAIALGRRAHELHPDEGPLLLLYVTGKSELANNHPISALKAFRDLVKLSPSQPNGYLGAADAFLALGSSFDAAALFERAAGMVPMKTTLIKLGALELKLGRPARALAAAERILAREPSDLPATVLAGQSFIEMGRIEDATPFWERATPAADWVEFKHGSSLAMMGFFKEAETHFQRSVALQPSQGVAYQMIFANRRATVEDRQMVAQMEQTFADGTLSLMERAALAFGLGKACDDLDDPEKAFCFFDAGHRVQEEMLAEPFSLDSMKEHFELQKKLFSSPAQTAFGATGPAPIFVVGMMRSGTTLVEQILSAHSQVVGAGEIDFWAGSEALLVDHSGPSLLAEVARERASTYRRILDSFGGGKLRVVDKYPGNLGVIGMIHRILPDAHIITLRRNPIDIAVSLWATYSDPCSPLTVSRRSIVDAIGQSAKQADYWKQMLPPERFLDVRYEDLVSAPELWTRRILEFCGLSWDDACLNPAGAGKKVRTPSLWQVRQPIYKTSIERWKRYEPWLGEFAGLLG